MWFFLSMQQVGPDQEIQISLLPRVSEYLSLIMTLIFAFGLVAFGFLSMGPVTIAVDSYGPVTDNAQSIYELSMIEAVPDVDAQVEAEHGFTPVWDRAKVMLEENDGAGNTFKATAKPVLIGTAVVGATTMIFSIIVVALLARLLRDPAGPRAALAALDSAGLAALLDYAAREADIT